MKTNLSSFVATRVPLIILTCISLIHVTKGEPLPTDSKITDVVVYADRARVTRSASVNLPDGETIVRFRGLPTNLDESSVQVSGEGRGSKIQSLEIRNQFAEKTINETVRKLQDDIQSLDDEKAKFQDQVNDLSDRREFLQKIRYAIGEKLGKDIQAGKTEASQLKATYDFYSNELKQLTEKNRSLQTTLRDFQPKRDKLQQELNKIQSGSNKQEKEVLVSIASTQSGSATLKLSYVMYGASWRPVYDARSRVDKGEIELTYRANIFQQTGEDWNNVQLYLSTARPQVGGRMPELETWFVYPEELVTARSAAIAAPGFGKKEVSLKGQLARDNSQASSVADGLEKMKEPANAVMEAQLAEIQSRGISMVFEVKTPTTIPSDGESHRSTVLIKTFKATFAYATTPKLSTNAYLKAHLNNNTDAPILAGEVNLFLENDFVGKSSVNFIAPTADFDFYLGVDDDIKVKRKELVNKTEKGGIFGMSKKMVAKRKYEIKVDNFKKTEQSVTVFDHIPVSKNSEIVVSSEKYSESPSKFNKETGIAEWECKLKPRESKTITIEFEVSYPEGTIVGGL